MVKEMKGNEKVARKTLYRVTALIVAIALLCAGTAFAASPDVYNVYIFDGNEATSVSTSKTDAKEIVMQAEILINDDDVLNLDRFTGAEGSMITIYRAADVKLVSLNGKTQKIRFAGTVADLLASKDITVNEDVKVNYPVSTQLVDGMKIVVSAAFKAYITVDGEKTEVALGNGTVADAINKAGIELGEDDIVTPALDSKITDGIEINIDRVKMVTREEAENIKYSVKTVDSSDLYKGTSKITQQGVNGKKTVTYEDKYVNGELESTTVLNETVVKEAVSQIKTVGTKERPVTVSAIKNNGKMISELSVPSNIEIKDGVPTSYKRIVTGKASAYHEKSGSITASGRPVKPGYIAVDPSQFPYGTKLWVVSTDGIVYGYCIAADTGGFVKRGKFTVDLYMNSESQCEQWGARNVIIYVL